MSPLKKGLKASKSSEEPLLLQNCSQKNLHLQFTKFLNTYADCYVSGCCINWSYIYSSTLFFAKATCLKIQVSTEKVWIDMGKEQIQQW